MEVRLGVPIKEDPASIHSAITSLIPPSQIQPLLGALDWLSAPPSLPSVPSQPMAPIDLFTTLLAHKLQYEPNDRDVVILWHEIVTESRSGPPMQEVHTSSLVSYGTPAASAMSRCVGLPVALAALQVLDGGVVERGVTGPTDKAVYSSVLKGLSDAGLGVKETVSKGAGMEGTLLAGLLSRPVV
jgi:alpha-aminoadipic semialdehyde synthase